MQVYSEYQVKELLRQQRENCAEAVQAICEQQGIQDKTAAEKDRKAPAPVLNPCLEVYVTHDLKRCFMAGFGAGFDASTKHAREDEWGKLACFHYLDDFNKWFLAYNRKKEKSLFSFQKEKTVS